MTYSIDLNADVGEGLNNEPDLMPFLSSCNIACGGHAGNSETMTKVVQLAKNHDVKIGAHPSYPDKENFGRVVVDIDDDILFFNLRKQIMKLLIIVESKDLILHHVKPHGALYNYVTKNEKTANTVLDVIESIPRELKLYAPPNSIISELSTLRNIEVVYEGFADRNYNDDLTLVSRSNTDAVLNKKEVVLEHVLMMIKEQKVKSINRMKLDLKASTYCVHGDTPNALEILKFLHLELPKNDVKIR